VLTAFGTEWQGIGPTPAEALDLARRARSAVLPHVEDVVRRLEHALGILAQGGDDVMDHDLVDEVARLVGLTRMPPVVNVWTVRAWLVDLRRALAVP
jgi:hypothetical protein